MVARCSSALLDKHLPHGLHGSLGHEQAAKSRIDVASNLEGEAQVYYPNLYENLENNTSPIKCITCKFLSLNKANIKT